jgi:hypothetical protein
VRAYHAFRVDFPLNDGGLFYVMVRDVQAANYGLPSFTSYNQVDIPFAYPPLGMYLAALVEDLTPLDLLTVFRVLPLVYCLLTLGAFFLLARQFLTSRVALVAAVAAFALIPRSFIWLIMGGGVTRGLGLLLALLALRQVYLLYRRNDRGYLWSAIPLAGATVLSHLETGSFLAFSILLLWLFTDRTRRGFVSSTLLAAGAAAIVSPWAAAIVARHGLDPFLGALSSSSSVFSGGEVTEFVLIALARMVWTSEAFFPLIGALGVIGALIAISRGSYFLPAWWAATILLDARAFHTYSTIPVAILAGYAVAEALLPLLLGARSRRSVPNDNGTNGHHAQREGHVNGHENGHGQRELFGGGWRGWLERVGATPLAVVVVGVMLIASVVSSTVTRPGYSEVAILQTLGSGQRAAMEWIEDHTPPDAQFLVVPRGAWQTDEEAEWFPVFTGRTSVATVQGWEWIAGGGFDAQVEAFDAAWDCGYKTAACLEEWMQDYERPFEYVYIPADFGVGCCATLIESLSDAPEYRLVYRGAGGSVYARVPA